MVNTAVQMDQEATPHVSGQPNSTPGTTHPWEIERPCRHPVTPFPDVRYRMVFHLSSEHWHGNGESHYWICLQPLFVSPVPDPSAMAVDALSMSRKAPWAYAYPPPALLPRVLEKAQQDQCELILIAPHWPQAIWFPLLLTMLVQSPLRIPNIPRLLSQPWGQIHRDPSNLQLPAWRVSGIPSAAETVRSTLPPVSVDPSESLLWRSMSPSGGSLLHTHTH